MCLIAFAWQAHADFPLIVAANRDEYHARPTAPSAWWPETPEVLAGRDLRSGGSWMGISRQGRFAALTNFRGPELAPANAPSRGKLVIDYLRTEMGPHSYAQSLEAQAGAYNGFNLLAGNLNELVYFGNREASPRVLAPGAYGLSNAWLDTPWPKLTTLKAALGKALGQVNGAEPLQERVSGLMGSLFRALENVDPAPIDQLPQTGLPPERERALSAAMIIDATYGTRASTVLCVTRQGTVFWEERTRAPIGATAQVVAESFQLD